MKIIKEFDHLKLLKLGLSVSIFSIGYLITMFYFQMRDIQEYKYKNILYNTAIVQILELKSEFERDNYFVQSLMDQQNIHSKKTKFNDKFLDQFFQNLYDLNQTDSVAQDYNNQIFSLTERYQNIKNKLLKENKISNKYEFNNLVFELINELDYYSSHLKNKISEHNTIYESLIQDSKTSGFLIALISLVIFVLAYVKMNEDLYELKKINNQILFHNQILNNAEMVAGFGSWKINTVLNTFKASDNFYRLSGILETNNLEENENIILNQIHPEDREEAKKMFEVDHPNQELTTVFYRNIKSDGTLQHMVSVSKFLYNHKEELIKIGVNQDISELIKKTQELEENNNKLIAINSELESFNNIVSHDLQEPLRKIQMFISRIDNKDFQDTSSKSTLDFFEKIKSAASRMQNLMNDLLEYNKTIKEAKVFELVDLNSVFNEIKDEFAFTIESKHAVLKIDHFPMIRGIRFQMQQLFINLISNSLKYVKTDVKPVIEVKLEQFDKEMVDNNLISGDDYYKITVRDNGIGFEEQYSEKIFLLFKRLPTNENYKGTGIGLAICKKIVSNHDGFIVAKGVLDEGSVFSIYFPKSTVTQ
ncbi:ATP-binding protein [Flavobacterium sp.]|uniref:sensor histidine kinase n=1 Tax=Flavobacterium sp. TaxID=239 RepID=UPI00262316FB|nr:ATP-binding protein [Flavobacterium sp.]MDD3005032.1 ATP-binding protein [Flavobacterium sp.]